MQKTLNSQVKYRESFPAVRSRRCMREDLGDYFDIKTDKPLTC